MWKRMLRLIGGKEKENKRIRDAYNHGYDYAAGCLLREEKTPYGLEVEADTPSEWNMHEEHRAFDRGIIDAVDKLVHYGLFVDNRFNPNGPQENKTSSVSNTHPEIVRSRPRLCVISSSLENEDQIP